MKGNVGRELDKIFLVRGEIKFSGGGIGQAENFFPKRGITELHA